MNELHLASASAEVQSAQLEPLAVSLPGLPNEIYSAFIEPIGFFLFFGVESILNPCQ